MRNLVAGLGLLLCLGVGSGCAGDAAPSTAWQEVSDLPLKARSGPVVVWTGTEALVIGGDTGPMCPPNADCAAPPDYAEDGAAYDPETTNWRRLSDAPTGVASYAPSAYVDGVAYVLTDERLLAYDVAADSWSIVEPPGDVSWSGLVAHRDKLVLPWGSDEETVRPDHVYDPSTQEWSTLPEDPIGPAFSRTVASTPHGLVLTGHELVDNPGSEEPSVVLAALLDDDGRWRRLPDSDQLGGGFLAWSGTRLVDPSLGGADGGEVNGWGRTVPYGGILELPSGTWSHLPDPPRELSGGWPAYAHNGPFFANAGYVYDDRAESWTYLPRPAGAPEQIGPAVWMGDRLLVVGGEEWRDGEGFRSRDAWVYDVR
jgi:hypothetical protein